MKSLFIVLLFFALAASRISFAQSRSGSAVGPSEAKSAPSQTPDPDAFYHLGPDSLPQEGVPKGEIRGPFTLVSSAYPGTQHTYWVYVPAQYDPAVPASLMIYNDGHAFMDADGDVRAQNVMDNLIFRRELPVMIVVFINPGRRPDQPEPDATEWGDHTTNRPTEYNTLDDKYARVIVDELMPALNKQYFQRPRTARHRGIKLGRHRRFHRCMAASERIPQGPEQRRKFCEFARRRRLSRYHQQER